MVKKLEEMQVKSKQQKRPNWKMIPLIFVILLFGIFLYIYLQGPWEKRVKKAYENRNYEKVISYEDKILHGKGDPYLLEALLFSYYREEDFVKAIDTYHVIEEAFPVAAKEPSIALIMGNVYYRLEKPMDAIAYYEQGFQDGDKKGEFEANTFQNYLKLVEKSEDVEKWSHTLDRGIAIFGEDSFTKPIEKREEIRKIRAEEEERKRQEEESRINEEEERKRRERIIYGSVDPQQYDLQSEEGAMSYVKAVTQYVANNTDDYMILRPGSSTSLDVTLYSVEGHSGPFYVYQCMTKEKDFGDHFSDSGSVLIVNSNNGRIYISDYETTFMIGVRSKNDVPYQSSGN